MHPILIKPYVANTTQLPPVYSTFHGYAVGLRPLCNRFLPAGSTPTRQRFRHNHLAGATYPHFQYAGTGCGTDDYRSAQRQVRTAHSAAPLARTLCCLYHCLPLCRRHTHLYRVPSYPGFCRSWRTGYLPLHRYRPLLRQRSGTHLLTHGGHQRSSAGRRASPGRHHARMDRLARHLRHTPGYRHHTLPHRLGPKRDPPAGKPLQRRCAVDLLATHSRAAQPAIQPLPAHTNLRHGCFVQLHCRLTLYLPGALPNLTAAVQYLLRGKCLCHHGRFEPVHTPLCQRHNSPAHRLGICRPDHPLIPHNLL